MMKKKSDYNDIPPEIAERAQKLRWLINDHSYRYYVLDAPEISDSAYDALFSELEAFEKKYPDIRTPDSPTLRVGGAPIEKFAKVRHKVLQWSFNNVFSMEEFMEFHRRVEKFIGKAPVYLSELKIDGFKIVLTYEKGLLVCAATRGDGMIGEDVTANIRTVRSIPLRLTRPVDCIVEGEIWMPKDEFERINEERAQQGDSLFANPRNAAAGTVRQLDPKVVATRHLDSFAYDISSYGDAAPPTQEQELTLLSELGFKVNPYSRLCKDPSDIMRYWKEWSEKRNTQKYLVDGMVIKVNDRIQQESLGYTAKAPRFGVAFKFPAEEATTVVEDIRCQVGRTGVITPVAHLRPVRLAGSVISRATLHNEDQITKLDVRIGDTVILHKAGDVIPEVVRVIKELRSGKEKVFHFPKYVEACGGPIERISGMAAYRCVNRNSFTQLKRRIEYFTSRSAFDIDGLGPKIVELLMREGLVSSPVDFFTLKEGDLIDLPGFGEKSARNLIDAINARRTIGLPRFLIALSIEHVGEETAHDLAQAFGMIENIEKATKEELMAVPGIGEIVAASLFSWMRTAEHKKLLKQLLAEVRVLPEKRKKISTSPLYGKTIVLTGGLEHMTREEAKLRIRDAGANVSNAVSPKTDIVVVGKDAGSKLDKAKALGIRIMTEDEFLTMVKKR